MMLPLVLGNSPCSSDRLIYAWVIIITLSLRRLVLLYRSWKAVHVGLGASRSRSQANVPAAAVTQCVPRGASLRRLRIILIASRRSLRWLENISRDTPEHRFRATIYQTFFSPLLVVKRTGPLTL
ncbi:hypothetical protein GY45DRAFT_761020 [Cubamyces sp. BRFM 1775]|nr:hypothetical protein GY45DRAFT_761020 [Cubamyces sp. BRFM 1775]